MGHFPTGANNPVEQTNFPPDWRSVQQLLYDKIASCVALVHIAGLRYGAEPASVTPPPDTRRSYTQLEYDIGCRLQQERGDTHFRVYVFVCPEDFPYGTSGEPESVEQQAAQCAHRAALLAVPRRYETPATPQALKERVLSIREPLLALQHEQTAVRTEVQRSHRTMRIALAMILLSLAGGWLAYNHFNTRIDTGVKVLSQALTIDAPRIKTHLLEASERTLVASLLAADELATSEARERAREEAEAAHKTRMRRIDDVVASFSALMDQIEVDPIMREMGRILQEEGLDQALTYAERKRPEIFAAVDAAQASHEEKIRTRLRPLLNAAQLHATRGDERAARDGYMELFARQPDWPELLHAFGWYLEGRSQQALEHGSLRVARADADRCIELARRWYGLAPDDSRAQRLLVAASIMSGDALMRSDESGAVGVALQLYEIALFHAEARYALGHENADAARDLSVSLGRVGDTLMRRGQPGDAQQAVANYTRSLEIVEGLLKASPGSAIAARDVSIDLDRMGDVLLRRGQPGDTQQAAAHYARSLEIRERLRASNPESAQAAREVSISLNQLGELLTNRGQPGDAQQAVAYFTRSLEVCEGLRVANPDSAQSARDVSASLNLLGDVLMQRGQANDAQQALEYYSRSLKIGEDLLVVNPDSAQAARDVSVTLNKLSDVLLHRGQPGDAQRAGEHITRSLKIREGLLLANPDNLQTAREVAGSLMQLGNMLVYRGQPGDTQQAVAHFTRGLKISEGVWDANPDSAHVARDVALCLSRLGFALMRRGQSGDAQQAVAHYTRSLEISEALRIANPDSALAVRDVSVSLNMLGAVLMQRGQTGDEKKAVTYYTRALEINEGQQAANPDSAQASRDLLVSFERLADANSARNDAGSALAMQIRALDLAQAMHARYPASLHYGRMLAISLIRTSRFAELAGDSTLAQRYASACRATLNSMIAAGVELDAEMSALRAELAARDDER